MKKILLSIFCLLTLVSANTAMAQRFSVQADTVWATVDTTGNVYDKITDTVSGGVVIKWNVVASNFPSDWVTNAALGICDNQNCYTNLGDTAVWKPSTNYGAPYVSAVYAQGALGDFHLNLDLNAARCGSYYMTIDLKENVTGPTATKAITFVITKGCLSVPVVPTVPGVVSLYPNPASNEINVVYDNNADIKIIAVYNILGKVMSVYKVAGNSANLDLENIPSGIYFARLINAQGEVVTVRKFSKQ